RLPVDVVKALEQGVPILVTRWRSSSPGEWYEAECGNVGGTQFTRFGDWTPPIRIDTDDRPGHCKLQYALIDPERKLGALKWEMKWAFEPNADTRAPAQCGGRMDVQTIPFTRSVPKSEDEIAFSEEILVNTDSRRGGCVQEFRISDAQNLAL